MTKLADFIVEKETPKRHKFLKLLHVTIYLFIYFSTLLLYEVEYD